MLLIISHSGYGHRHGQIFNGYIDDRCIVCSGQPFLDASRILINEGIDPNTVMIMRHKGSNIDALIGKIGIAAKLTVDEGDSSDGTPRFKTWKPFPDVSVFTQIAEGGENEQPSVSSKNDYPNTIGLGRNIGKIWMLNRQTGERVRVMPNEVVEYEIKGYIKGGPRSKLE